MFFLFIFSFGTASAEEKYSEDYFVLKSEKFPPSEDTTSNILANGIDLVVDGEKVSSRVVEDFNLGGQSNCSGTMSFKLDGGRDTKTGTMKGTFLALMKGECPGTEDTPASPISLTWEGTFDGYATFTEDPMDGTKRRMKGKINNLNGESVLVINNATIPSTPKSVSIDFPEVILEGYNNTSARFSGLTGQVEWRLDNDPEGWHLCKLDTVIPVGAHIRTAEDSSAILSSSDLSSFILKQNSEVVVTMAAEKESKLKLVVGNIWVNVKKIINEGSMEIEMNQAVAGIKGTTFILSDDGKTSTLQVIEGEVSFTSKSNGEKINVAGGNMVSASAAGLSDIKPFNTAEETANWDVISGDAKNVAAQSDKDMEWFKSKGLFLLYGLIGILVIFIFIIIIRKIKR